MRTVKDLKGKFVITHGWVGNSVVFYAENGNGYTTDPNIAELWDLEAAKECRDSCKGTHNFVVRSALIIAPDYLSSELNPERVRSEDFDAHWEEIE